MKGRKRLIRLNLQSRLTIYLVVLVIIAAGVAGAVSRVSQYRALNDNVANNLTTLATLAAKQINGDNLAKVNNPESENTFGYLEIQDTLRLIIESANQLSLSEISKMLNISDDKEVIRVMGNLKIVYAYTMYVEGDKIFYGVDAYPASDKKNHSTAGSVVGVKAQGEQALARASEQIFEVLNGKGPKVSDPYKDEFGTWRTGVAAVYDHKGKIIGAVGVDASLEFINEEGRKLTIKLIWNTVYLLIAIIFIAVLLSRKITKPILKLNESVKGIGDGNFDLQLDIHTGDEIQDLADAFTTMTEKLKVYIQNLSETTAAKERIESELKIANSIQSSMLPRIFPPFPDRKEINIFATMEPAKEVGGDFYDFFFIDQNRICLCIADVSGKGVPAALFMVISKTLIKNHALLGLTVEEIMSTVNDMLCSDNDQSMFVTAFLAILEVNTGRITFSDAGHNLPLICRKGEEFDWLTCKKSFVLGGMENTNYSANEGKLEKGDRLFIYTDGITEAMNRAGLLYSDERLERVLNENRNLNEQDLIKAIRNDVIDHVRDEPQSDDITMLVLRYNGI